MIFKQNNSTKAPNQNALNAATQRAHELAAKFNAKPPSTTPKSFGKKANDKKKSQLELFKEEIKAQHDAREAMKAHEREKAKLTGQTLPANYTLTAASDQGDPNSTNIFISAISSHCGEDDLMHFFGRYGPLASVKIMYPRTEEEKRKERNCAFVAFCCRKDAERCMSKVQNSEYMGIELKLGWGKSVPNLGTQPPIYVPERLKWLLSPPKPSQLPLNAQLPPRSTIAPTVDNLHECTVRVVIPNDMQLVRLINRVVEHVVKEGPMFEAIVMDKESNNPMFQFLYDFSCPAHTYYRWRLYSVLNGESLTFWRTKKFRMYAGGPLWKPPILPFSQYGMPPSDDEDDFVDESREKAKEKTPFLPIGAAISQFEERHEENGEEEELAIASKWVSHVGKDDKDGKQERRMPSGYRNEFDSALHSLSPVRDLVGDLMALCLEQVEFAEEIVDAIVESLLHQEFNLNQCLARVYLISDILYNSTAVPKASRFRALFDAHLSPMFEKLHSIHAGIESRFVAEQFRTRIRTVLRAWATWSLFTSDTLIKLNNIFIGLQKNDVESSGSDSDSDVDGVDLDSKGGSVDGKPLSEEDDVDGIPMVQASPPKREKVSGVGSGFVQSKWEAVDEDEIKAEAVTSAEIFAETKRIETEKKTQAEFDKKEAKPEYLVSPAWRKRLRDIEVKVMEYCEQLKVKEDSAQAEEYRSTLIRQATNEFKENPSLWEEKQEREGRSKKSKRERSRDRRRRSRSRSRERRRRSYSRSRSRSRSRDRSRKRRR